MKVKLVIPDRFGFVERPTHIEAEGEPKAVRSLVDKLVDADSVAEKVGRLETALRELEKDTKEQLKHLKEHTFTRRRFWIF